MVFWKRKARAAARPRIWGRGDIAELVSDWPEQRRYEIYAAWVARYLPIWHEGFARYADAVDLADSKRELFTARVNELLDRCDALRAGEAMPKARVNETESAVSALSHGALRSFGTEPWTTTVRTAALQIRHLLRIAKEGASPGRFASGVYDWAEMETRFPGDSSAMLQQLTLEEREAAGPGYFDGHHLLYGRVAREWGLGESGQAVYAAVDEIMQHLETPPKPYVIPDGFWQPGSDLAREQRATAHEQFHGKQPPKWLV